MLDGVWWHTSHTILSMQFSGTLKLEDVKQMMERGYHTVDKEGSETGVGTIIDISRCDHYSKDLMNLQAMRALSQSHPRVRWVVVIDPNPHPAVRFIGISIFKILRINFSAARSEAEALAILEKVGLF